MPEPLFPPENPYAAPGVVHTPYGGPPQWGAGTPAGFGIRAGARIIDIIVGAMLGGAIGIVLRMAHLTHVPHHVVRNPLDVLTKAFTPLRIVTSLVGPMVYNTLAETMTGASIGKLLCNLRVRSEDGGPVTFGGALLRNLLYPVDALCFGLLAYVIMKDSPRQQRLGDRVGKAMVITKPGGEPALNLIGIVMGLVAYAVVVAGGTILG